MGKEKKYIVPLSNIQNMNIEMGYQCNIRCIFCYQEDYSMRLNIKPDIWKDKLLPVYANLKRLTFIGGEPTIMEGAREFSDFIVKEYPHIKLNTITNGLRFNEQWIEKFISHGHKIIFSLNAATEDVYRKVTKYSNWGKILDNIRALVKEKEKHNSDLIIEASFVVLPENICDIGRFIELCHSLGFDKAFLGVPLFHQIKKIDRISAYEYAIEASNIKKKLAGIKVEGIEALINNLFPEPDSKIKGFIEELDEKNVRERSYYDKVCKYPWQSLYINHSGDVSVCCAAWFPIGNLYKNTIEDIWNRKAAQHMRRKIANGDYSLCKRSCPININPSRRSKESMFTMAHKLIYRIRKDPRMAIKKIKKEIGRWQ
jgi:MoaA/NifB/PqqE/SkfB family radical SAM enzyme